LIPPRQTAIRRLSSDVSYVAQTSGGAFVMLASWFLHPGCKSLVTPKEEDPMTDPVSTTLPGVVKETIHSSDPTVPEIAQIAIQGADGLQQIRIDNTLTMKNGDQVSLKKGAAVEVTIKA
jgi:hypothetical protein